MWLLPHSDKKQSGEWEQRATVRLRGERLFHFRLVGGQECLLFLNREPFQVGAQSSAPHPLDDRGGAFEDMPVRRLPDFQLGGQRCQQTVVPIRLDYLEGLRSRVEPGPPSRLAAEFFNG